MNDSHSATRCRALIARADARIAADLERIRALPLPPHPEARNPGGAMPSHPPSVPTPTVPRTQGRSARYGRVET